MKQAKIMNTEGVEINCYEEKRDSKKKEMDKSQNRKMKTVVEKEEKENLNYKEKNYN